MAEHPREFTARFAAETFEVEAGGPPRAAVLLTNCSTEVVTAPDVLGFLREVGSHDWHGGWFGFAPLPGREMLPGSTIELPVYFGDRQHVDVGEYDIRVAMCERESRFASVVIEGARLRVGGAVPPG